MKKIKVLLTLAGVFFLTAAVLAGSLITQSQQNINEHAAASTNLYISPRTQGITAGDNVSFSVVMDTGSNKITGIDLLLNFDPNVLQITSIQKGSGIGSFDNSVFNTFDNVNGTISFAMFTINKNLAVDGSALEVLQINAQVKSTTVAGSYLLSFDPSSAASATGETSNVITGTSPGTYIVATKPTATPIPTASPTPTQNPTAPPGNPNSCNGTCGSNANCQSAYICYQGYCRNPSCQSDSTCICKSSTPIPTVFKVTPKPTINIYATTKPAKPTASPTPISSPIPTVFKVTPKPEEPISNFWQNIYSRETTAPIDLPTLEPIDIPEPQNDTILPWIIGAFVASGVTLILITIKIYRLKFPRSKPPVIKL